MRLTATIGILFASFVYLSPTSSPLLATSLGTQLASGAVENEERPLSSFTDEQIALEFQKRWVELTEKYNADFVQNFASPVVEAEGKSEAEHTTAITALEDAMLEALDALKPFANIGFMPARAELGGLMTYDNNLETRCAGYAMLREAALYGHPSHLFQFQMLFTRYSGIEADKNLYYLLGRELVHRLPSIFKERFPSMQLGYSNAEKAELEAQWLSWSVESTPAKLLPECPTTDDLVD